MGQVFSCLASSCQCVGEVLENICLAVGEIGAVLVRSFFTILVGLLDLLASLCCCWRVPWTQRPPRTMVLLTTSTPSTSVDRSAGQDPQLSNVGGKRILYTFFTKQGRQERKSAKAAAMTTTPNTIIVTQTAEQKHENSNKIDGNN